MKSYWFGTPVPEITDSDEPAVDPMGVDETRDARSVTPHASIDEDDSNSSVES